MNMTDRQNTVLSARFQLPMSASWKAMPLAIILA